MSEIPAPGGLQCDQLVLRCPKCHLGRIDIGDKTHCPRCDTEVIRRQCRKTAAPGFKKCGSHLGPAERADREFTSAQARVRGTLERRLVRLLDKSVPDVVASDVLKRGLAEIDAICNYVASYLVKVDTEADVLDPTSPYHVVMKLYERWTELRSSTAKRMLDAQVAERDVAVNERTKGVFVDMLRNIVESGELGLTAAQKLTMRNLILAESERLDQVTNPTFAIPRR